MNFLFSPNFKKYIDIDYASRRFLIRKIILSTTSKIPYRTRYIPMDIVGVKAHGDKDDRKVAKYIASRMMFASENHLRVITDGAFDCLFEIPDQSKYFKELDTQLKLVSYTKLDNYKMDSNSDQNHAFLEKKPLLRGSTDVFNRLLRMNHK